MDVSVPGNLYFLLDSLKIVCFPLASDYMSQLLMLLNFENWTLILNVVLFFFPGTSFHCIPQAYLKLYRVFYIFFFSHADTSFLYYSKVDNNCDLDNIVR